MGAGVSEAATVRAAGSDQARTPGVLERIRAALPEGRELPASAWGPRHRALLIVVWAHALGLAVFGTYHLRYGGGNALTGKTWLDTLELGPEWGVPLVLGECALIAAIAGVAAIPQLGRRFRSAAAALALVMCSAVLVQFWGGYIEAHFHFFIVVAVVALYQDWIPFLLAIVYVAVEHGLLGALAPEWVYNHPAAFAHPWRWGFYHAVFVLGESVAVILSWDVAEKFRARSEQVLRSAGEGILGVDLEGKVTFANPAAASLTRYGADELLGTSLPSLFESPGAGHACLADLRAGLLQAATEVQLLPNGGTRLPVEYTRTPVTERGRLTGAVLAFRDITARKAAEAEIRLRARQQEILSILGQRALAAGDLEPILVEATQLVAQTLDVEYCNVSEALPGGEGFVVRTATAPEERAARVKGLRLPGGTRSQAGYTVLSGRAVVSEDLRTEARFEVPPIASEFGLVSSASVAIAAGGRTYGVLIVHTTRLRRFVLDDVNFLQAVANVLATAIQRREAEAELAARAKELERSNKELDQFAYVASHDLQEPLRSVASYVQLLQRRYKGRLDKDADEFIQFAVDGSTRMSGLVNDLLTFSRVAREPRPLKPTPLDLVVDGAIENLQAALHESGARVTRDPLPTVLGDATQLGQVFQNLLSNALKFRGQEPPQVHIGAAQHDGEWELSVKDNGIGIEARFHDKVFVIFQRVHEGGAYPGSGIGLAVCKKIVERHGGRIWFDSAPGRGTTFRFTLHQAAPA